MLNSAYLPDITGFVHTNKPILAASVILSALILAYGAYAVTLHPLADIPGPRLCAISRGPYWYYFKQGRDVKWLYNLHQRYGPVVRFGPMDISYAVADAWKDIYGVGKGRPDMAKPADANIRPANGIPSILIADTENHARMRKTFSPAFSERALRKQEALIKKYVDILISKLHELSSADQLVEMTSLFNFTTFDIMADLCFGHPFGMLAKNEFNPWIRAIFDAIRMLPVANFIQYYPVLDALFIRFQPEWVTKQRLFFAKQAEDRVNQRLQEGSEKPDIWNLVMAAEGTDNALSLGEMHSNADLFMMAGSETTATLLSGITYYLLKNTEKMQLLCSEIRTAFNNAKDINMDRLASLKYLNACLKEALRLYPPVAAGMPRIIPKGGATIHGRWLPENTRASCHHYSMYHSAWNFKNPDAFVPERWLGDQEYKNDVQDALQPFAYGPRNCLGQNVAWHEMRLILATLLWNYELELFDKDDDWADQQTFALWMKKPLNCQLRLVVR